LVPEGERAYILITRSEVGVQKEIYTYILVARSGVNFVH